MRFLCVDTLRASDIPHICQNCHVISYVYACRYTYGCVHKNNKNKCLYMHTCVSVFYVLNICVCYSFRTEKITCSHLWQCFHSQLKHLLWTTEIDMSIYFVTNS